MKITIKRATYKDCEDFCKWENEDEVIRYLSISKGKTMEMTIREFIKREEDATVFDFGVYWDKELVGRAFLSRYDQNAKSIDITRIYIGDRKNRGKGMGTKLMQVLMAYCFEELNLNRVTLDYLDGNPAQKIYENLGFVGEGVARQAGFKDGTFNNFNLMSMLKTEYEKIKYQES